ncbi:hypothetical protein BJ912DRAFT_1068686 [Pholiota molesta]|nr:hypothetical protein BJ912DRAFT_1068686 [Pholiota molesta]
MHPTLLTALLAIGACLPAHASSPSGTPTAFACPAADNLNFALGASDLTVDPIFCSYPAVPDESPSDFFCTYSKTTGALVEDHDAGLCPPSAPLVTNPRRRDAIARAPLPTRPLSSVRGVKDSAARRSYLKKRRASPEHAL